MSGDRPVRVLYFINGFHRGGAELGLLQMIRGGVFAGTDFTLAAAVGGPADLIAQFEAAGAKPIIFDDRAKMRVSDMARAFPRLGRLIDETKPDVLILSLPQANIVGRIAGRMKRVPTIVAFEHNSVLARKAYTRLYRMTAGCVDVIFADCPETLRIVLDEHYAGKGPAKRYSVPLISLGAPPAHRVSPAPSLVMVGRMTPTKNHALAIRAISLLRKRGEDVRLTILGDGDLRGELEALAREEGVADLVSMPGFKPQWWTHEAHTAFLLTSTHEGLCIVAVEAMWAGLPVIAPHIGGLVDYADETTFVPLADWKAQTVADAIARVVSDAPLRER
ncbi:MAG: glycosyltransferase, partial [Hyphomonadaceae bacterium]